MDWEEIRSQLENVLQSEVTRKDIALDQWHWLQNRQLLDYSSEKSVMDDQNILFLLEINGDMASTLSVKNALMTQAERKLTELMITNVIPMMHASESIEEKSLEDQMEAWLMEQFKQRRNEAVMPPEIAVNHRLNGSMVPLVLYGAEGKDKWSSSHSLKNLLDIFFDEEILLIPLVENEWLILSSEHLLEIDEVDMDAEENGSMEDALVSMCSGVYEMLSSEWIGGCHLSISYPIIPAQSLLATLTHLRQTVMLGKSYHPGQNIHFPWKLEFEKLIHAIPKADKDVFLQKIIPDDGNSLDEEMLSTLEHFFDFDCNVSETAKKLYIHRNTLLYRLDKVKQETGLDVRKFDHAVLVKVALLLYKVTKSE